jgi:DNA-binding transcriptional MerR regulator
LAEYRLEELATASGVSSRNIRAYRERGLLDPPRREGRASVYDEHHLGQLKTISDLLRRGFSSAHIFEFFTSLREGHELADLLGLQEADFRRRARTLTYVDVDPTCPEASQACAAGLAWLVDGRLRLVNSAIGTIVAAADDPLDYLRALLRVHGAAGRELESVAAVSAGALEESIEARYGENFVPSSEDMPAFLRHVADYRAIADHVVADLHGAALARRLDPRLRIDRP